MAVTPNAVMRRSATGCPECTAESLRISVASWRFLADLDLSSSLGTRTYLTAGPFMRVQLSSAEPCPRSAGDECALAEFARSRVDPGLMLGLGWEPHWDRIGAVQLTGHLSYYGRNRIPEAAPVSWLPSVELSVFFPLDF